MDSHRDTSDPALDALLRSQSTQAPPPHVDAAILAAAHRAAGSAPHGTARGTPRAPAMRRWRWWMPLAAAAAIATVVVGLLPLAPVEPELPPPAASDSSAGAPATPPAPPPMQKQEARAPAAVARERQDAAPAAMSRERQDAAPAAMSRDRPAPEAAPAGKPQRLESGTTAGAASGIVTAPAAGSAADWIARIRALRSAGKTHEAEQELARFRAAFSDADARLPVDLRAWADSLRRRAR
ncbi:MAG TPA: hypothetical protein VF059_07815 [Casimicrobiaceae bacterium]